MGISVKIEYKDVEDFINRMANLRQEAIDSFFESTGCRISNESISEVTKRTPVITGHLRRNWAFKKLGKNGDTWTFEIYNPISYALYVEEGHRQQPGRFVPGYWQGNRFIYDKDASGGMVLKQPFVEGRHMLKDTLNEKIKPYAKEYIKAQLDALFGGL